MTPRVSLPMWYTALVRPVLTRSISSTGGSSCFIDLQRDGPGDPLISETFRHSTINLLQDLLNLYGAA
jgi:hypothetical protein